MEKPSTRVQRYASLTKEEFAARCRAARAYADLTMEEVAPLMGITRQAVSRRENCLVEIDPPARMAMGEALSAVAGWREEVFFEESAFPLVSVEEGPIEPHVGTLRRVTSFAGKSR